MHIHKNSLRMYRKKSPLNQADIAYLLRLSDYSSISRWEQGQRTPNNEILLAYHVLFGMPVDGYLIEQKTYVSRVIAERLTFLLNDLKSQPQSQKVVSRAAFLESLHSRLTS